MSDPPDILAPVLARLDSREHALARQAEALERDLADLAERRSEIQAERDQLAQARKTLLRLDLDVPAPPTPPAPPLAALPENPIYAEILGVFTATGRPQRIRDLCHALDLSTEPKVREGLRHKLKRMVQRGVLTESEPGVFALA